MGRVQGITGVVLAGGQSSRFGTNKALAPWRGLPLIQHVTDTLAAVFGGCLLVTNTPEDFPFLNLQMIGDKVRQMGPLAGIQAALDHVASPWIFVLACDMPAVPPSLVTYLCSLAKDEFDAVIPWLKTGAEPLCGLYHKKAGKHIEEQLRKQRLQLRELLAKLSVRKVKETELLTVVESLDIFFNVNRQQDLELLD